MQVSKPIRWLITIATYLVALPIVAVTMFFLVIFLAGPHGGVLPTAMQPVVLVMGWLLMLSLPILVTWLTWRRLGRETKNETQGQ